MNIKFNALLAFLLISALLLSSCGEGGNTISNTKPGSEPTNSSQIILSPYDSGLEEKDTTDSSVNSTVFSEEYLNKEFPKISTENISSAVVESRGGLYRATHQLTSNQTKLLLDFINSSKLKIAKVTREDVEGLMGAYVLITFNYSDGSTVIINGGGYVTTSLTDGYFQLRTSSIENFCRFILGIELFIPEHNVVKEKPAEYIEPELRSGLAHNTVVGENSSENSSVFQKIARENLSKVTVLTRANAPNPTRIVLTDEQTQKLFKHGIDKIEFVPANLTKDDFSYDYGDYFRIIFDYADGSQVQIAYDDFYHSSLTNGYFRSKNGDLGVILNEVLQIKIYPYE